MSIYQSKAVLLQPRSAALHFQVIQIFEKQNPRGLFRVIQLGGATRLFPENIIDIFESLFEHGSALKIDMGGSYGVGGELAQALAFPLF